MIDQQPYQWGQGEAWKHLNGEAERELAPAPAEGRLHRLHEGAHRHRYKTHQHEAKQSCDDGWPAVAPLAESSASNLWKGGRNGCQSVDHLGSRGSRACALFRLL